MNENYSAENHIFKDCEFYFLKKLGTFHDRFLHYFLSIGIDKPEKSIDQIKVTKNPMFSSLYYERIVKELKNGYPLINIRFINDKKIHTDCGIFYINNLEDIEGFYFVQRVMNWKDSNLTSHQIWEIDSIDYFELNNHWL